MGALPDDPAVVQHEDQVRAGDGGDPLGDHELERVAGLGHERGAQSRIGGEVQRAEGVVEEVQRRLRGERPGDAEPLALPAGDVRAALRDRGVELLGHRGDEVPALGDGERVPELLLVGVRVPEAEVRRDGAGEQVGPLRHEADPVPEHAGVEVAHVVPVQQHAPLGRVHEARDEVDQGGLAGAGAADDRDGLPCAGGEGDVLEHGSLGAGIGEGDVLEGQLDRALDLADPVGALVDAGLGLEHLGDALGGDHGARDHHRHEGRHHHRDEDLHEIGDERGDRADLHLAGVDARRGDQQHEDARHVQDEHDDRVDEDHQQADAAVQLGQLAVDHGVALPLAILAHEGAQHADAGDLLAQHAVDVVDLALHLLEQGRRASDEQADGDEHDRHHHRDQPGHPRLDPQREDHPADPRDGGLDQHVQGEEDQHLHLLHVVRGAGDEGGGAELGELARGEGVHAAEDRLAQVLADPHRGAGGEEVRRDERDDVPQRDHQHDPAELPDHGDVGLRDAVVDDVGVEGGEVEGGQHAGDLEEHHEEHPDHVRLQASEHEAQQGHENPSEGPSGPGRIRSAPEA